MNLYDFKIVQFFKTNKAQEVKKNPWKCEQQI